MESKSIRQKHYLEAELLQKVQSDSVIFEFLQAGSLDGIWYWDLEAPDHEWMSARFWETLGVDPSTKRHDPREWQDLIHPEDAKLALENLRKHCDDPNHPYDQLVRYRHADGSTVWIRCRGLAIRDEQGRPIRMLGAHNHLPQYGSLRAAMEHLPLCLALTRDDGQIVSLNQSGRELLGWAPQDALLPIASWLPELVLPWESSECPVVQLVDCVARSGQSIPVEVTWSRLRTRGEAAFSFALRDLRMEQRLRCEESERKVLEARMRSHEEFHRIVSHDLKSPLRRMRLIVGMLEEDHPELSGEGSASLSSLRSQVELLSNMLGAIVDHARFGHVELRTESVELEELLREVLQSLELPSGYEVVGRFEVPTVVSSRFCLRHIFQNLVANAVTHRGDEGTRLEIESFAENERYVIAFDDDGPGIPDKLREYAFEMFQTLGRAEGQMGMGLTIARALAERLSATLKVEESPLGGARFVLDLPDQGEAKAPSVAVVRSDSG